jgi:hypothetical protein
MKFLRWDTLYKQRVFRNLMSEALFLICFAYIYIYMRKSIDIYLTEHKACIVIQIKLESCQAMLKLILCYKVSVRVPYTRLNEM